MIRWHRAGFRAYWRWKSRSHGGRPKNSAGGSSAHSRHEYREPALGRTADSWRTAQARHRCRANDRCQVHGARKASAIPRWKTFLRNHADGIASMDLFVVPTISFLLLYGFLVLRHSRREILWLGVTAHPSAQWIARQLSQAYGWQQAPQYIVRDRDCVYRDVFIRRVRAMGIRDTGRSHHDRHGRTDMRRGSSVRSDGIVLTMSLSSTSGIFATCRDRTKNITMMVARTYR